MPRVLMEAKVALRFILEIPFQSLFLLLHPRNVQNGKRIKKEQIASHENGGSQLLILELSAINSLHIDY